MCNICCKSKIPPATAVFLLSFVAVIVVVSTVSFNIASLFSGDLADNLFGGRNLTDAYYYIATEMTIPGWGFLIWIAIYAWQALWVMFITVVALYRYKYVPISYFAYFLYYTFNVLGSLFIVAICHLQLIIAMVIMFLNVCLSNSCFNIVKNSVKSCEETPLQFPQFLRYAYSILVVNGLALYASWTVVQLAMVLDSNLVFLLDISLTNSAFITSGILIGYYIIYFVIDVFIFKHSIQISFMYYSTVLYYFSALSYKRGRGTSNTTYGKLLISLISICVTIIVIKIVVSLARFRRNKNVNQKHHALQTRNESKPLFRSCKEDMDDYIQLYHDSQYRTPFLTH